MNIMCWLFSRAIVVNCYHCRAGVLISLVVYSQTLRYPNLYKFEEWIFKKEYYYHP
jgi:hypothetical protein